VFYEVGVIKNDDCDLPWLSCSRLTCLLETCVCWQMRTMQTAARTQTHLIICTKTSTRRAVDMPSEDHTHSASQAEAQVTAATLFRLWFTTYLSKTGTRSKAKRTKTLKIRSRDQDSSLENYVWFMLLSILFQFPLKQFLKTPRTVTLTLHSHMGAYNYGLNVLSHIITVF